MISKLIFALSLSTLMVGCQNNEGVIDKEKVKKEIIKAEAAFDQMAREIGVREAFVEFAADSAVLQRRGVIKGKEAIASFYGNSPYDSTYLTWKPDFVDVSASGDLGYTYGRYTYVTFDREGVRKETNGIFHTVWKKQKDGTWKYVYD